MIKILSSLLVLLAISALAESKKDETKGNLAVIKNSPVAKAEKHDKKRLASILADLKTLDNHDVAKLHRILMHGRVLKRLNKALKKEANKNILVRLSSSDEKTVGKKEADLHLLKRFMLLGGKSSMEKLAKAVKKDEALKANTQGLNKKLDANSKNVEDAKSQK